MPSRAELEYLLQLNPLATARHGGKVMVHRKTKVRISRHADIEIEGQLLLGRQWPGGSPLYAGHFNVREGARLEVNGRFGIMTGLRVGVAPGARLILGDQSGSNTDLRLSCYDSITIGNNVIIGDRVTIRDSDNHPTGDGRSMSAPIVIEDDVWIALGATILKGVTVGRGAIVAAGAVVTRDVPPGTLVTGVPATVKREGVAWTK